MPVKMWGNRNSHSLLEEVQNYAATLTDSLAFFFFFNKIKYSLTLCSSNHAPWYLHKGTENLCLHKTLNTRIYSNLIYNLKATEISFGR